jgi:hypothetical protein
MQYRLRTLMIVLALGPPSIGFLWFHWRFVLVTAVCLTLFYLWVWANLRIARFFGWLVASMMG